MTNRSGDEARSADPDHAAHHRRRAAAARVGPPVIGRPESYRCEQYFRPTSRVGAAVALVASCDTRLPTATTVITGTRFDERRRARSKTNVPTIDDRLAARRHVDQRRRLRARARCTLHDATRRCGTRRSPATREKGSVDLGTFTQTPRYSRVTVPVGGCVPLRAPRHDGPPLPPADQPGRHDARQSRHRRHRDRYRERRRHGARRINIVAGPKVTVVSPTNGDSIPAGVGLNVAARAQHPNGVGRIDIRVQGEANWPTKLDTTFTQVYTTSPRDITFIAVAKHSAQRAASRPHHGHRDRGRRRSPAGFGVARRGRSCAVPAPRIRA